MNYRERGRVKEGWQDAGRQFDVLGSSIELNGTWWTPIIFDMEEDPTWIKTRAFEFLH